MFSDISSFYNFQIDYTNNHGTQYLDNRRRREKGEVER